MLLAVKVVPTVSSPYSFGGESCSDIEYDLVFV